MELACYRCGTWDGRVMSLLGKSETKVGEKFHRYTVVGEPFRMRLKGRCKIFFVCQCECGTYAIVAGSNLRSGACKSCGCFSRDRSIETKTRHGLASRSSTHPLYVIWQGIKNRCYVKSNTHYEGYGGRGIEVGETWLHDPGAFVVWALSNGWKKGLQIDRINNDGPYSPENCRITTATVNARNKRNNKFITAFGETKTLEEWAEDSRCVVCSRALRSRLEVYGYAPEDAITLKRFQRRNKLREN